MSHSKIETTSSALSNAAPNPDSFITGKKELMNDFLKLLEKIPERDPRTFFAFSPEVVKAIFAKEDTRCVLMKNDEQEIVAGGILWRPSKSDPEDVLAEHEGEELGLKADDYWQLDNTVVVPSSRGAGLQAHIVRKLLDEVTEEEIVVATVSPENPASKRTLLKCGFEIRKLVKRHEDFERYIVSYMTSK